MSNTNILTVYASALKDAMQPKVIIYNPANIFQDL